MRGDSDPTVLAMLAERDKEYQARGEINEDGVVVIDGIEMVERIPLTPEDDAIFERILDDK